METAGPPRGRARTGVYLAVVLVIVLISIAVLYFSISPGAETRSATIGATPTATSSNSSTTSVPASEDWLTYHYDNLRDGDYAYLPALTEPGLAWTAQFNGEVYAEPLVYGGAVYVATEGDTVYALSSATGKPLWSTNLGTPVPLSSLQCGDINPVVGITGTPVIDPSTGTLYVVAMLDGQGYAMFALSTSTGAVAWSHPIDPSNFNATVEQERGALTLSNGLVYVPFGGFAGDCGQYHGWVVAYPANGTSRMLNYQVLSDREAGIWAPGGPVVGPSGSLYVATGNSGSENSDSYDYGDAVIELTPSLEMETFFAPTNWVQLNAGDLDLGSVSPVLLENGLLFQIGKQGIGYLLNASLLEGIGYGLFQAQTCESAFGAAAFNGTDIFVPCDNGLFKLSVVGGAQPYFYQAWAKEGFNCGPPIIGAGAVWAVDTTNGTLFAFNPQTGSTLFKDAVGQQSSRFTTPAAGDGLVFVASGASVEAFSMG